MNPEFQLRIWRLKSGFKTNDQSNYLSNGKEINILIIIK